jgi:tetratricopeptide (TPR) repeat protein
LRGLVRGIIISFIFLICVVSLACAYTGEAGPPMLKMIYGSRALSLGGAFVGLCDDTFYIDSNPAGGDTRSIYKISILHQEWIEDVNYEAIRFTGGIADRFFFGAGFTYLYLPFIYYDYYGGTSGKNHIISQSLGTLNFGYTFRPSNISIGANLKLFYNHIPEELYPGQSYLLFASDVGFLWKTNLLKGYIGPDPSMIFGIAVKNLGYSSMIEKLPVEIHAGVSYRFLKNLLVSTEVAVSIFEQLYGSVGVEYDFSKTFFLEGGIQIKENPMFAVGLGYKSKDMMINISYTPSIEFYNMISASFSYYFGVTKFEESSKKSETFYLKALEYYRDGKYSDALEMVERVLDLDPGYKKALQLKNAILVKLKVEEERKELEKE